jgi:hypothetical protein
MARMSAELARELFIYEPDTGLLRWRVRVHQRGPVGSVAGTLTKNGYTRLMYKQSSYLAHCVIWAIQTGSWPEQQIDHRNRVRTDNRWDNLRAATRSQNARNCRISGHNTSGVKGVHFVRSEGKWQASARIGGKVHYFGQHKTLEEAATARRNGVQGIYGDFANEI